MSRGRKKEQKKKRKEKLETPTTNFKERADRLSNAGNTRRMYIPYLQAVNVN